MMDMKVYDEVAHASMFGPPATTTAATISPSPTATKEEVIIATTGTGTGTETEVNNNPKEVTFPQLLMDVVEKETNDGKAFVDGMRVLEWLPSGDAFVIRDKAQFESEVLPLYFSAKCKFMSFVRKLYRWGFRQVEKNSHESGIMVFTQANFVRGNKQRCLLMRSIVKKQSSQQQPYPAMVGRGFAAPNGAPFAPSRQYGMDPEGAPFGISGQYGMDLESAPFGMSGQYGMDSKFAMDSYSAPRDHPPKRGYEKMPFSAMNRGVDSGVMGLDSIGMGLGGGGSSSLFMPGRYSPGIASDKYSLGTASDRYSPGAGSVLFSQGKNEKKSITSKDLFEAAYHLQKLEDQKQRQRQKHLMMNAYKSRQHSPPGSPSFRHSPVNAMPDRYGREIDVAAGMMKRNPTLEPWKALELAKALSKLS